MSGVSNGGREMMKDLITAAESIVGYIDRTGADGKLNPKWVRDGLLFGLIRAEGHSHEMDELAEKYDIDREPLAEKPDGWPERCACCGASWEHIGFDYADGFNCRVCGGCDADE